MRLLLLARAYSGHRTIISQVIAYTWIKDAAFKALFLFSHSLQLLLLYIAASTRYFFKGYLRHMTLVCLSTSR
jgi:hypothetical protein